LKSSIFTPALLCGIAIFNPASLGSLPQSTTLQHPLNLTSYASCYDEATGKIVGSRAQRTSTLVSRDGRFRAYAETRAVVSSSPGISECSNTSEVFVAPGENGTFRVVMSIRPTPERLLNDIALVDWSPQGHRLLLSAGYWQDGSELGEAHPQVYDADSGALSGLLLPDEIFSRLVGRSCAAKFEPLGFSPNGEVVVRTLPWFEFGEDQPSADSCFKKPGLWMIGFTTGNLQPLKATYRSHRYGKISAE